jgi:hypothetical protein
MPDPVIVLEQARRTARFARYFYLLAGALALIALAKTWRLGHATAIYGTVIVIFLSVVAMLLSNGAPKKLSNPETRMPWLILIYSSTALFVATGCALFSSAFFGRPIDLRVKPEKPSIVIISEKEGEFEQLLYAADNEVHKPFEKWFHPASGTLDCEKGVALRLKAVELGDRVSAFPTEFLSEFRETKAMAKHEYAAMLYCWAAAIAETCSVVGVEPTWNSTELAKRVIVEHQNVEALKELLFNNQGHPGGDTRLKTAQEIEKISTWYAGRAAVILARHGKLTGEQALRYAQRAHEAFPDEVDPWIDGTLSLDRTIVAAN